MSEGLTGTGSSHADILQTIIDFLPSGVTLFDTQLRMVACNEQLKRLLDFPAALFESGLPTMYELAIFNARRGDYGPGDHERLAQQVLERARNMQAHVYERTRPDGTVLEIRGAPLPDNGGFVTIYTDITERKRAEQEAKRYATYLDTVLNTLPQGVTVIDENLDLVLWNQRFVDVLELPPELIHEGARLEDVIRYNAEQGEYGEVDPEAKVREVVDLALRFEPHRLERTRPQGQTIEVEGRAMRVDGNVAGFITTYTDITERKQVARFEQFRSHSLEMLASGRPLPEILDTITHGLEQLNPAMLCSIALLDGDGRYLKTASAPSLPDFYTRAVDAIEIGVGVGSCGTATFTGRRVIVGDIMSHPDWSSLQELATRAGLGACWSQPVRSSSGRVLGMLAIYHHRPRVPTEYDISIIEQSAHLVSIAIERSVAADQVRQLAFYDTLTNLPNRRLLNDRLVQSLAANKRSGRSGALMFLDLDNFKPLNDAHGHVVGDLLLVEAAARLKGCVREMDTVARFGGDEFVVMLTDLSADKADSVSQARSVAENIRNALSQSYRLAIRHQGAEESRVEHHCTASIGVAMFAGHEASQSDILKWADKAMYQAKEAGRDAICFYASGACVCNDR
ncbi:PAS-domain containing protein [Sedimenticola hydrogenitrophicus]|uniref:PAS-domain containing protein n=1 Tax=Sedimenticola hydrogenitrophicus TaxID=2967975 RepID=UPI0023B01844|nr:PAS-domain containing protein [Sedimenticola hydrogenitrophicus]